MLGFLLQLVYHRQEFHLLVNLLHITAAHLQLLLLLLVRRHKVLPDSTLRFLVQLLTKRLPLKQVRHRNYFLQDVNYERANLEADTFATSANNTSRMA